MAQNPISEYFAPQTVNDLGTEVEQALVDQLTAFRIDRCRRHKLTDIQGSFAVYLGEHSHITELMGTLTEATENTELARLQSRIVKLMERYTLELSKQIFPHLSGYVEESME